MTPQNPSILAFILAHLEESLRVICGSRRHALPASFIDGPPSPKDLKVQLGSSKRGSDLSRGKRPLDHFERALEALMCGLATVRTTNLCKGPEKGQTLKVRIP